VMQREEPPMNGLYLIERARWALGGATRGGRWVLPLACGLVLAATLALVAAQALLRAVHDDPAGLRTGAPGATAAMAEAPDPTGSHWELLTYVDPTGRQSRLYCLTTSDRLAGDVLLAEPEEMLTLAFEACQRMRGEAVTASATPQ
jgi:hypothetical protein